METDFLVPVFMQPLRRLHHLTVLAVAVSAGVTLHAEPWLGDAPKAPADVSGLPGLGLRQPKVTGGFSVDTRSREQVRSFYNAVYTSSDGVPIGSTSDTTNCVPGTNSPVFQDAVLRRINWFRAMAGLPAAVTFDPGESSSDQSAAQLMSANTNLLHINIPPTWHCFSIEGTNAAANSNLALGYDGPDAVTGYIWDFGVNNYVVGHRRWILYPQTQVMGSGDVPQQGGYYAANATWVFDANFGGQRPATRTPYVQWPPAGYAPYQVVFPQWSFALSNADLSAASVSMMSNGVSVAVTRQTYTPGYGENTLVWYPSDLDPTKAGTIFPFSGTDTVYTVIVSGVITSQGTQSFTNTVTIFDPAVPGPDYAPPVISGPDQPAVNARNAYGCTSVPDPNVTGYQWLTASSIDGNFFDGAEGGLTNFTISPAPMYPVITNSPVFAGTHSFHLTHASPVPQLFQLNRLFFPSSNSMVSFQSQLGYATTNEVARVQVSTDGGSIWQDIFAQAGKGSTRETSFNLRTLSLSNFVAEPILIRFDYDFASGSYYPQLNPGYGWALDNIVVTNISQWINLTTNVTSSTNFTFVPAQPTNYSLQVSAVIFNEFPLAGGPVKTVSAVAGAPIIQLATPVIIGNQIQLNFSVASVSSSTFHLLQVARLGNKWTTNSAAVLTTNVPGSSYRFTATNGSATQFYRVQTP